MTSRTRSYHSIVCCGALVATKIETGYEVRACGASHVGQRTERELIESFVQTIERLTPKMVTFKGCSFDLPVLRYRAVMHGIPASGPREIGTGTTTSTCATCCPRSAAAERQSSTKGANLVDT
jgi:DNA polymerase elongation subunit (family B)